MRAGVALAIAIIAGQGVAEPAQEAALNALRAENGLAPLAYSDALNEAAVAHAQDMAQSGLFSHTGSDGSDVGQRVTRVGYGWCVVAENIAKGQVDLAEVMQAWAGSPGHRANMLSPEVSEFAIAQGADALWVMVLAAPGF